MPELYVGRSVDPDTFAEDGGVRTLRADQLTRHAVCFGMTGSGKTGLCVTLLEELAMAGVPLIVIDPKGDMANLALAFAEHRAEDFRPWVDPALAEREGISVDALAEQLAQRWREGLAAHDVTDERVRAFVERAQVTVYTPGSTAGVPVDVLAMLRAPDPAAIADAEVLQDLVGSTVTSLLGLIGVDADPVQDPRHIVLSRLVQEAWQAQQALTLEALILGLVDPPFPKIGVFPVDTFFPRKDRMQLAMQLNGVAASPAFATWSQGVPLDVDALLSRGERTPVHVFTLAHLDEPERMFFCSMLLGQIVAWSRRQPGSSALRALVYFDEVMGFLPPHPRNPPTKKPVLTLMKQARAVGVGTMLVTQNPVDIDYAAASNAGLWLMGRLQTRQDRDRVLDGLSGATGAIDRSTLSGWLEALPGRTFLLKDVTRPEPLLLKSRWAISYLRGPLTRRELERLPNARWSPTEAAGGAPAVPSAATAPSAAPAPAPAAASTDDGTLPAPPPTPPDHGTVFLSPQVAFSARLRPHLGEEDPPAADGAIRWRAGVLATLRVRFEEGDAFELERDELRLFYPVTDTHIGPSTEPPFEPSDFLPSPPPGGRFHPIPAQIDEGRELATLQKQLIEEVYRGETEHTYRHRALRLQSRAGETAEAFRVRVRAALDDAADARVAKLHDQVQRQISRLEARRDKLAADIDQHASDVSAKQTAEMMNIAETALAWFTGRKRSLNSAVSRRNTTRKAGERLTRAQQELQRLERELYDLEVDLETKIQTIRNEELRRVTEIEDHHVRLKRAGLKLTDLKLLWIPVTRPAIGAISPPTAG